MAEERGVVGCLDLGRGTTKLVYDKALAPVGRKVGDAAKAVGEGAKAFGNGLAKVDDGANATVAALLFVYVKAAPKYWRDTAGSLSAAGAPAPEWWSFSAGKWYGTRRAVAATTPLPIFGLAAFTLRDAL